MLIVEQSSWNVQQVGTPSASSRFRGYRVQETQWRWRRDGMEKGISSADLCSVSPTCRARGNHFSILQRPGFLSNSLSFFSCVFISLPLLLVSHVVLCCAVHFSLFTCSLLTGIKFHWKSRGTHLRHTMNTRYYSAAAHKLSLPCKRDHKPQLWGEGRQDAEGP